MRNAWNLAICMNHAGAGNRVESESVEYRLPGQRPARK
jgi:hypothetical protein